MARKHLTFRIAQEPAERIEHLRAEYQVTTTQVVRSLLAVAFRHLDEVRRLLTHLKEAD